jgi:hypothetical protein
MSADTLTVKGTGGLYNGGSSSIDIEGNTTTQATLNVANAAAGFGTAGTETGTVFLQNDALLEFKSGQITTINGTLWLDGASARVADAGKTASNSALTGLTNISGNFPLWNGAKVVTAGNLSGSGMLWVDGPARPIVDACEVEARRRRDLAGAAAMPRFGGASSGDLASGLGRLILGREESALLRLTDPRTSRFG